MKNSEFKITKSKEQTVYTLESASVGGTSSGSVASVSSALGGVRKRNDNLLAQESDKDKIAVSKPRNYVAKNAKMGGAGAHKDKKKEQKQGAIKHKKPYMESLRNRLAELKEKIEGPNRLFVKKLMSEQDLIEHAKKFSKNLSNDGVPITSKNRHTVVCSTIFAHIKNSLNESTHITSGKQIVQLLKKLDQFSQLPINVGSSVAIINSQLQGDSVELWGFTTPRTISKIYRDPSDKSIKQFEFNNDPNDVWPRTENAEYNGQFLMYSAFFGDKKSADRALTMLMLKGSGDLDIRNHITEQDISEGDDLKSFKQSLGNAVRGEISQIRANTAIEKAKNPGRWKWHPGDMVYSPTTGKTYEIVDHYLDRRGNAMYLYKAKDEKGSFIADKAHQSLKKISEDVSIKESLKQRLSELKSKIGEMISKAEAHYTDRAPGSEKCKGCTMFKAPNACSLVKGTISPNGYCEHYNPKSTSEGYSIRPGFDKERYRERPGLEGPFHTKSGKVVYYDPKEGKYYDPDSDFYIDYDDWKAMNDEYMESLDQALQDMLNEKAPPGDKYERMVKHIKKGYAKDGKLSKKEKSIAYATAWKAKNKSKK